MEPLKPPGHTCPGIDDALASIRALLRVLRVKTHDNFTPVVYEDAIAALERVRQENSEMRRTYVEAMAYRHIANEAIRLLHSGYDGCISGPEVEPLIRAITAYERRHGERHATEG